MSPLRGAWPGGPSRNDEPRPQSRAYRLDTVEQIAHRKEEAWRERSRSRRRRRLTSALAAAAVVAVAAGVYLGLQGNRSSEELTAERRAEENPAPSSVVEELLEDPTVKELLAGERVEADAARRP